jgi:formate dehydrogenase major subunit
MQIETHSPALVEFRRTTLAALARRYPSDLAARTPELEFHRYLREFDLDGELPGSSEPECEARRHPYISVDMGRCVRCCRCVRICDEVQGERVWRVRDRGFGTAIVPDGASLAESRCVSCGACVDTCPTGALEDVRGPGWGRPSRWTRTTCPYCGTGCEMLAGAHDGRIVSIRPAPDAPVNKGHLCVKGRYAFAFVNAADRVLQPMIRAEGEWRTAAWPDALAFVATGLRRIVESHGPEAVAILGSARATNEENYLAQKLAREALGTGRRRR